MSRMRRVGVFGGTFDPIHIGHLGAVEDAAHLLALDEVLFVPNNQPPHKAGGAVSPVIDRVAMLNLAIASNPLFSLSQVELDREGPSYTLDTLRILKERLSSGTQMTFLMGCDALRELHTWYQPEILMREFDVVVMDRPAAAALDWGAVEHHFPDIRRQARVIHVVQLDLSSSDLRRRVAEGSPIRYYVLPEVEAYIRRMGLYRPA